MATPKSLAKELIARFSLRSGVAAVVRRLNGTSGCPLILYYHRVCEPGSAPLPDLAVNSRIFEHQLEFLKEEFRLLSLDAAVEGLVNGKTASSRDVALTFDDGYRDNYTCAYPILKKYGVPATIFVTTGFIESKREFWWDRLASLLERARGVTLDWESLPSDIFPRKVAHLLRRVAAGKVSLSAVTNCLKAQGARRVDQVIAYLQEAVGPVPPSLPAEFLSWKEIREMAGNGISFGSHSHSHTVLTALGDEAVVRELRVSKTIIRDQIGKEPTGFAYPDGWFDERTRRLVMAAGYHYAVQTHRAVPRHCLDAYSIPRRMVANGHSRGHLEEFSNAIFASELAGVFDLLFLRSLRARNPYGR